MREIVRFLRQDADTSVPLEDTLAGLIQWYETISPERLDDGTRRNRVRRSLDEPAAPLFSPSFWPKVWESLTGGNAMPFLVIAPGLGVTSLGGWGVSHYEQPVAKH